VIDTQTLWDQLLALYGHLEPTYDALLEHMLRESQLGADETWWRLMESKASRKWWDWCLASRDAVYHRIHPERSARVVEKLLEGYEGVVISDGFAPYETLSRAGPARYRHANCWAHARRKYAELEPLYPEVCGEVLDLIGELYAIERTVPGTPDALELRRQELQGVRKRHPRRKQSSRSESRRGSWKLHGARPTLVGLAQRPAYPAGRANHRVHAVVGHRASAVGIGPMPYRTDVHDPASIVDGVNHTVIANSDSPQFLGTLEFSAS